MSGVFHRFWNYWNPELPPIPKPSDFPKSPDPMSVSHIEWTGFEKDKQASIDRLWEAMNARWKLNERRFRVVVALSVASVIVVPSVVKFVHIFGADGQSGTAPESGPDTVATATHAVVDCNNALGPVRISRPALVSVRAARTTAVMADSGGGQLNISPADVPVEHVFGGTVIERYDLGAMEVVEVDDRYTAAFDSHGVVIICATDTSTNASTGR